MCREMGITFDTVQISFYIMVIFEKLAILINYSVVGTISFAARELMDASSLQPEKLALQLQSSYEYKFIHSQLQVRPVCRGGLGGSKEPP